MFRPSCLIALSTAKGVDLFRLLVPMLMTVHKNERYVDDRQRSVGPESVDVNVYCRSSTKKAIVLIIVNIFHAGSLGA
jgi:hypothetical protein